MNRTQSSLFTMVGCGIVAFQAAAQINTPNPAPANPPANNPNNAPAGQVTPPVVTPPDAQPGSVPATQPGVTQPAAPTTIPGPAPDIVPDAPILPGETPPIVPNIQPVQIPPPVELPPPPNPNEAGQAPLTADEAARIALRNQPNVVIANAGIMAAQGRVQQVRSGLGPTIGVGAGYTNVRNISGNSTQGGGTTNTPSGSVVTTPGYQSSVNTRQLLFDFGRTRNEVRQASSQLRAAGANLTRVQSDLVLQVKQAFYTYVQDQRLIAVNEANVRSTQSQLALAQARLGVGTGLPSDVVRAQTSVADAVFNLDQARNTASIARTTLALAMGIDPRTPIQAADSAEPTVNADDVNALVTTALRQRPEILQAQANVQASNFGVSAARANNLPTVSANVGIAARSQTFPPNNGNLSAGVSLQWNPFDNGLTRGLVREAEANRLTAQQQLVLAGQTVTTDVAQAYLNLRTAEQHVTTTAAEVANAQESVRLAEGRYRGGVGTFLDVITAEAAFVTAQTNQVNAGSALDQARAALTRAIGANLPALPAPIR
ncbi:MAG: TolC family protein [Abitibacteriaceae bacterium]|nr:TolC family protein [Abditibacteriaceae bacterium]